MDISECWPNKSFLTGSRLHTGDIVRLGTATFRVSGALTKEPDRVGTAAILGPRVLVSVDALASTGLISPGAMVRYQVRLTAPDPVAIARDVRIAFPGQAWRIRDPAEAAPGVGRFIDQTALFLTLVGLTSLLVGGIGVANGVRAWLDARALTIATLRCLGASASLVFAVCLLQVLTLAAGGIVVGVIAGAVVPLIGAHFLAPILPVPPVLGIYLGPLGLAALYGLLVALCFALWPLGRAARIPGGALFRDGLVPEAARPSAMLIAVNAAVGLALVGLTVATAADRFFAMYFCAGAGLTLALFRAGGAVVMWAAKVAPGVRWPSIRLGVGNLHRPGAPAPLLLLSAGLGLSTLAAVALIQGNMQHQIQEQLPSNAPSFFFIDIQNDQLQRFDAVVREQPGVEAIHQVPSLRARIVAVKGVPVDQVVTTPETAWALRGDRGLTYAASPPEGTHLVAGAWWPSDYSGPPLVSFDAALAKGWHVAIGDVIRVNVLGRDIDLKIANFRDIAWQSLAINFFMVASPGLLSHAPHTHIATVRIADAGQGGLLSGGHRRFAQRDWDPYRGRTIGDRQPAEPSRCRTDCNRGADADFRSICTGWGSCRRSTPPGAGGGYSEDPRRHAMANPSCMADRIRGDRGSCRAYRGSSGVSGKLRRCALHYVHGLDFFAGYANLHSCGSTRTHVAVRLCWNGSGSAG